MARPEKVIDWVRVATLAEVQTPRTLIAAIVGCSVVTIERAAKRDHGVTFTEYVERHAAEGKAAIQKELYERAFEREDKFSAPILLYLDKKYVGGGVLEQAAQPQAQTIQIVNSSTSTVDLLREVLGKPKLVGSGESEPD